MRFLQLVQQQAGVSRRRARALIEAGRVRLNGKPLRTPFIEVDPAEVRSLHLDGQPVEVRRIEWKAFKFYKPRGMTCTRRDPHNPHTLGKVLHRPELEGCNVAGRLDRDAEGLLLLTNDGALIQRLTHPRYGVEKTYRVTVAGVVRFRQARDALERMQRGIADEEGRLRIVRGRLVRRTPQGSEFELVLAEGRKHEVKRLFRHFGWSVQRLVRTGIGPISLEPLEPGQLRPLSRKERRFLRALRDADADADG